MIRFSYLKSCIFRHKGVILAVILTSCQAVRVAFSAWLLVSDSCSVLFAPDAQELKAPHKNGLAIIYDLSSHLFCADIASGPFQ